MNSKGSGIGIAVLVATAMWTWNPAGGSGGFQQSFIAVRPAAPELSERVWAVEVADQKAHLQGTEKGQYAPDFALLALEGNPVRLSELKGEGQNVLLNFWASYCPVCRREMPLLEALHQAHEADDLIVIGINIGEDAKTIQWFVAEMGVSYPVLLDRLGEVTTAYGVVSLPATFLVDEQGIILWKKFGMIHGEQLRGQL